MKLARAALGGRTVRTAFVRAAFAGALLAGLASGATAEAESARRVVLVVPEAPGAVATEALARVRGELQAARFEVETDVVGNNVERRATVERALRKAEARASFGIFFGSGVAEIWVSDSVSGRTVVQTLPLSAAAPERRAAVLAVKAVNLLKATLAEVWVATPIAPAPAAPPPAPPPGPTPPQRTPAEPAASPPTPAPSPPPPLASASAPRVEADEHETRSTPLVMELSREEQPERPLGRRLDLAVGVGWIGAGSVSTWAPLVALSAFSGHVGGRLIATGFGSSSEVTQTVGFRPRGLRAPARRAGGAPALRQPFRDNRQLERRQRPLRG